MDYEVSFDVRKRSTLKCIIFMIITLGWYFYVWLWKLIKDFNDLNYEQNEKLNFWAFAIFPLLLDIYDTYHTILNWNNNSLDSWENSYFKIIGLVYLTISVILIRKFEEFAQNKYNVKVKHNGFGIFFFTTIYVNFAMNTFKVRVEKALAKQPETSDFQ